MIFFCRWACCPTDNFFVFLEKCAWPFSGNPLFGSGRRRSCLLYHSSIITICYVFMLCPAFNGVEKHPHPPSSYALCSRLSFSTPTAPSTGASICCTFAQVLGCCFRQAGKLIFAATQCRVDYILDSLQTFQPIFQKVSSALLLFLRTLFRFSVFTVRSFFFPLRTAKFRIFSLTDLL